MSMEAISVRQWESANDGKRHDRGKSGGGEKQAYIIEDPAQSLLPRERAFQIWPSHWAQGPVMETEEEVVAY